MSLDDGNGKILKEGQTIIAIEGGMVNSIIHSLTYNTVKVVICHLQKKKKILLFCYC